MYYLYFVARSAVVTFGFVNSLGSFSSFNWDTLDQHYGVTFASWSPSLPVSEPSTALLLGLGLTGLAGKGRRRSRS